MATTIDELIVRIKADTAELERALPKIKKPLNEAEGSTKRLAASFGGVKAAALTAVAAVASISVATKKIVDVGMAFEDLQTSLNAVFGSVTAGQQAFDDIKSFAQETPFQLETATQAFINLKASGIEPNIDQLKTFANVASVATDSVGAFEALVRVTQRASQGAVQLEELNILADRGIPVFTALERQLGLTRDQVTKFGSTSDGAAKIMSALTVGLQEITGDAMAQKMENLSVKTSNLEIALKEAAFAIYEEGGLGKAFKKFTDDAIQDVNTLTIKLKSLFTGAPEEFFTAETNEERIKILDKESQRIRAIVKARGGSTGAGMHNFANNPFGTIIGLFTSGQSGGDIAQMEARALSLENLAASLRDTMKIEKDRAAAAAAQATEDAENTKVLRDRQLLENELSKLLEKNADKGKILQEQIAKVNDEISLILGGGESKFTEAQLSELLDVLQGKLDDLNKKSGEVAATFAETMAPAIAQTVNAFTTDFVNALMEGASALDTFKDLAKNIVSQIISTFLQMAVINKILNAIFGKSGFNVSGYSPLPELASGGSVSSSRPVLVGERGPELFIPHSAGSIKNAQNTRGMMSGGGVVINQSINLSTGVQATVRSEVMQMLPMINDVTKAGVLEAASRGGKYRRGLLGG